MLTFNGIPAAPGIAIGKAHVRHNATLVYREGTLDEAETQNQLRILQDALRISAHQLGEIADAAAKAGDAADAEIMQAHLAILEDEAFTDEIADEIVQMHMFAETAVRKVCQKYEAVFAGMDDAYMRERAADVSDICLRIAKNILGVPVHAIGDVREACVVIAHDLTPSDTMQFDKERILAFCTEQGGRTSHSAIIAKTHEIPAVMGLKNIVAQAGEGETVIVDGNEGVVLLNPDAQTLDRYSRLRSEYATRREALKDLRHLPAETKD
ncbi:MAG: phosphoenolpyruvate--protein phosphotransferase, partial [Clostridiales Family XIII bacterium]|nr:phosphoenolpyruvate--protein phosphotransferase [Clostridiales Family XIII bacterium]